ncbi:MAG: helix-turn-helix transcriptional regulator [Sedimentisphaerales bacterium]|nr:helix-turn-helix transcriptional regulator [Sedimentisphaerales bacterium]
MIKPCDALDRPIRVASESFCSPDYHQEGRNRQDDQTILFLHTLEGLGIFRDGDGEHEISAGRSFLCEVNDSAIAYYYPSNGTEDWQFIWIGFTGEPGRIVTRELIRRFGAVYDLPGDHTIIKRLEAFKAYDGLIYEMTPFAGAQFVMELLTDLGGSAQADFGVDAQSEVVRQAQQLINERLTGPMRVSEIAEAMDVSREHLARVFRDQIEISPSEYIEKRKIQLACELLKNSQLTNKEISARLGFRRQSHFSRSFGRLMNMPPSQFRKEGTIGLL